MFLSFPISQPLRRFTPAVRTPSIKNAVVIPWSLYDYPLKKRNASRIGPLATLIGALALL
jgi:hypothetical protein